MSSTDPYSDHSSATADEIFKTALDDFKSKLSLRWLETFANKSTVHAKCEILSIQHRQESLKSLMNLTRMQPFLDRLVGFESFCDSTAIDTTLKVEISANIWGPLCHILPVSAEDVVAFDNVLDAFQELGRVIPDLQKHKALSEQGFGIVGCMAAFIYKDLLQFYAKVVKLLSGWVWKRTFLPNWQDYQPCFKTLLASFEESGKTLESIRRDFQLNGAYWTDLREQHDIYLRNRQSRLAGCESVETTRQSTQRDDVLRWLSYPGVHQQEYHQTLINIRKEFPETGVWILKEHKIRNWIYNNIPPTSLMWLNAKIGAGKTILASVIVDACQGEYDSKTGYFYCLENDPTENSSAKGVLRGILHQLVTHDQDLIPSCYGESRRSYLADITVVKSLLELFCQSETKYYFIMDGLDKCDRAEAREIVNFWESTVKICDRYSPGKVRVLFVTKDSPELRKFMRPRNVEDMSLDDEQIDKDIQRYVSKAVRNMGNSFDLTEDEILNIRDVVCRQSQGMFIFAHLLVQHLLSQPTTRDLKNELHAPSTPSTLGLRQAYHSILNSLEKSLLPGQWKMAKRAFGLLAGATRPLKENEFLTALSIRLDEETGQHVLDRQQDNLADGVSTLCGNLVRIVDDRVEFVHGSARSYVIETLFAHQGVLHFDLAVLTLNYLIFECFRADLDGESVSKCARSGYYGFQDYAIANWHHHIRMLIESSAPIFDDPVKGIECEKEFAGVLAEFVNFHRRSLEDASEAVDRQQQMRYMSPLSSRSSLPPAFGERSVSPSSWTSLRSPSPSSWDSLRSPSPISWASTRFSSPTPPEGFNTPVSHSTLPTSRSGTPSEQRGDNPATDCDAFQNKQFYPRLVEVWTHICSHGELEYKRRQLVSLPHLGDALEKSRETIAALTEGLGGSRDTNDSQNFQKIYGNQIYKCDRVSCDYFHVGFKTRAQLEKHRERHDHDRPFKCPFTGCTFSPFGFGTNKALAGHIRTYHQDESGAEFPVLRDNPTRAAAGREAKFKCDFCGKRFTRQAILKAHIDSHYGTRSHACGTCGKLFTRSNDRNRHQRIHLRGGQSRLSQTIPSGLGVIVDDPDEDSGL